MSMGTALILLWAAGQEAPWSRDAAGTREAALREGKPCILILQSDLHAL